MVDRQLPLELVVRFLVPPACFVTTFRVLQIPNAKCREPTWWRGTFLRKCFQEADFSKTFWLQLGARRGGTDCPWKDFFFLFESHMSFAIYTEPRWAYPCGRKTFGDNLYLSCSVPFHLVSNIDLGPSDSWGYFDFTSNDPLVSISFIVSCSHKHCRIFMESCSTDPEAWGRGVPE